MDIAVHVRRSLQGDRLATDGSRHSAADDDLLAGDHTGHLSFLADDHFRRLHIAFYFTVHLQHAAADDFQALTNDLEIVPDH